MSPITVLITGAARGMVQLSFSKCENKLSNNSVGLGRGMAAQFLLGANTTVIAGVRDVENKASLQLNKLPRGSGSKLVVVKIDSNSPNDAIEAVNYARSTENISQIDIAIANAGICEHLVSLADAEVEEMNRIVNTNTWGLLRLYQATLPFLREAPMPKLVYISSQLGCIAHAASNADCIGPYGLSKAAGNYMVQKIAAENPWLISFAIDPG